MASGDAELVALGVEHDDVSEDIAVPLLADHRRAGGNQIGHSLPNQQGALGHVTGARTGDSDIDVHAILGGLTLGHLEKRNGGTLASGSTMDALSGSSKPGSLT